VTAQELVGKLAARHRCAQLLAGRNPGLAVAGWMPRLGHVADPDFRILAWQGLGQAGSVIPWVPGRHRRPVMLEV
jgi:hypothetical protein